MSGHELQDDTTTGGVLTSPEDVRRIRGVLALGGVPFHELDDGLQTVRLKILEHEAATDRPRLRNPRAWAAVAATRVAIDWHRHHARQSDLRGRLASHQRTSEGDDPGPADRSAAMSALAGALDVLTPEQRQVVVLRFYCDLTIRDIATTLDLPTGTVKSRLHNSLRLLRAHLHENEEHDVANT